MNELRQIAAVSLIGIGSLRERYATALVVIVGMACVVGVLTSMLSLTAGLTRAYLRPRTRRVQSSGGPVRPSIKVAASTPTRLTRSSTPLDRQGSRRGAACGP